MLSSSKAVEPALLEADLSVSSENLEPQAITLDYAGPHSGDNRQDSTVHAFHFPS